MKWEELKTHLNREGDEGLIQFEVEGLAFTLEPLEAEAAVLLSVDVGTLVEAAVSGDFLREMLEANHLFAGTSGASLSVDPQSMQVSLQQQIWMEALDFDAFMPRMKVFIDEAKAWHHKVSHAAAALPEAVAPAPWSTDEGFILV